MAGASQGQQDVDAYEERLRDNTVTPPPDAAAFRIDWSHFLATLSARDRQLAHFLSLGHAGKAAARKFRLSPDRVTPAQLLSMGRASEACGWLREAAAWNRETLRRAPDEVAAREGLERVANRPPVVQPTSCAVAAPNG